jgi:DNA-directed RNA polymerase specialized sigma24 family protein
MITFYDDLDEFFIQLTKSQRQRIVMRYVLGLSNSNISKIENRAKHSISVSFQTIMKKYKKAQHDEEMVDLIQRLFSR